MIKWKKAEAKDEGFFLRNRMIFIDEATITDYSLPMIMASPKNYEINYII